jgi:hypothetical protein
MLDPDLIKQPDVWSQAPCYFPVQDLDSPGLLVPIRGISPVTSVLLELIL